MTVVSLLLWQHWREHRAAEGPKDDHGQFVVMATLEGAQSPQRGPKMTMVSLFVMATTLLGYPVSVQSYTYMALIYQ